MDKFSLLKVTIEIAKEYARGGGTTPVQHVLEQVYEMLKKLDADAREK